MNITKIAFLLLFPFSFACNQALESPKSSNLMDSVQNQKTGKAGDAIIVFKSTDGGQTWQNISEGLPAPVKDDYGVGRNVFFASIFVAPTLKGYEK